MSLETLNQQLAALRRRRREEGPVHHHHGDGGTRSTTPSPIPSKVCLLLGGLTMTAVGTAPPTIAPPLLPLPLLPLPSPQDQIHMGQVMSLEADIQNRDTQIKQLQE